MSSVNKPTLVPILLEGNDTVIKIFASMGTFSAILTSRGNLLVWGTGSWGHARKPTNIHKICQLDTSLQLLNMMMGDNYAVIQDTNNHLIFGSQMLPDLGS